MPDKFEQLSADLALCRSSRKKPEMFGWKVHRYELLPPLSEKEVAAFEAQHECLLPPDYRDFLLRVGNGGAGPAHGLFPLGMMDDGHDIAPWGAFVASLSKPFPHTRPWNDLSGEPSEGLMEKDEDEYWKQVEAFESRYFSPENTTGSFPICHLGCASRRILVVTGVEAGNVWCDETPDHAGLYPHTTASLRRVGFYTWYREWLDEALAKL